MKAIVAAMGPLLLGLACRGDDWIIAGELPRDEAGSPREPDDLEYATDVSGCPSAAERLAEREQTFGAPDVAPEFVGSWQGELQGYGFPGTDLTLVIGADGNSVLRFGGVSMLGIDDDAGGGYLCNVFGITRMACGSESGFAAGYPYPLEGVLTRGNVLSFEIVTADPWNDWCALQEPLRREDATQACGFSFDVLPPAQPRWSEQGCTLIGADGPEEIDCARMYALDHCDCGRDGCFASFTRRVEVGFALTADTALLRGSIWSEDESDVGSVVMRRSP